MIKMKSFYTEFVDRIRTFPNCARPNNAFIVTFHQESRQGWLWDDIVFVDISGCNYVILHVFHRLNTKYKYGNSHATSSRGSKNYQKQQVRNIQANSHKCAAEHFVGHIFLMYKAQKDVLKLAVIWPQEYLSGI